MKSKGIRPFIIDSALETPVETPLNYTYEEFLKDCEQIFSHAPKGPRLVTCLRCGETVRSDKDCSCGYIGEIVKYLKEKK